MACQVCRASPDQLSAEPDGYETPVQLRSLVILICSNFRELPVFCCRTAAKMVHNGQPGPANRSGNNGRGDPRTAAANGYDSENDLSSSRPRYHGRQPQPQATSKSKEEEDPPSIAAWKNVIVSYTVCRETIERSRELRNGRVGGEWARVIERRVQWLREDLARVEEALSRNKRLGGKSLSIRNQLSAAGSANMQ